MRDIRVDLQERARLIEDQISVAYAQFEKLIEQLQAEREGRVSELKSELSALGKLMEAEHRRMANVLPLAPQAPAPQLSPGPQLSQGPQTPQGSQLSLSDFIMPRCRRQSGSGGRCKRSSFSGLSAAQHLGDIVADLAFGIAGKLFAVDEIVERYGRPDADVRIERTQAQQTPSMAR